MASLDELLQILPPPAEGEAFRRPVDWPAVEREVGIALPVDYKALIDVYGVGSIDDFLWVHYPATGNPHLRLQEQIKVRLDALRELRDDYGELVPYPLFPESGRVLPWAATDNGDVCYWRTAAADPARWDVVVNEGGGPEWDEFPGTMTEFLLAVLTRRPRCPIFPEDFPSPNPVFQPRE